MLLKYHLTIVLWHGRCDSWYYNQIASIKKKTKTKWLILATSIYIFKFIFF
jgi:hypothetical protein